MTTPIICPTWTLAPIYKTISTLPQLYLASGLGPDKSLPKELTSGEGDSARHEIIWPGGKKTDLSFDASLFDLNDPGVQCLVQYVAFDAKLFETGQDPRAQTTYLAESLHQLMDGGKALKDANPGVGAFTYNHLRKLIGDEAETDAAIQILFSYQGIVHAIKNPDTTLAVNDWVQEHYELTNLALQKGALICRAAASPKKFYSNDATEYQIVCDKPANLANLAIAADRDLPAGGSKVTPSDFKDAAQQLKTLGLKPANLKEAGEAHEVMPDSAQGVLNATGYANHKAVPTTGGLALLAGLVLITGIGGYALGLRRARKRGPGQPIQSPPSGGAGKETEKSKTKKAARSPDPEPKPPTLMGLGEPGPKAGAEKKTVVAADDIARALEDIDHGKSPAGGARVSGAPASTAMDITADNVIISGEHAAPVTGLDVEVVKAQIALIYRHFLNAAAREALEARRPLPTGGDLINPRFSKALNDLIVRISAKYEEHRSKETLRDVMSPEYDRVSFIRGGAPQLVILGVGAAYISEEAARPGSPFEGGVGDQIRAEADRHAGEWDYLVKGMPEIMRHVGR